MSSLKYVKTSTALFSDAFVWGLCAEHKLLWCYICHPPDAELHGIWRYSVDQIARTLDIPEAAVRTGLELFETADRIYTTETHIWVKRFFRMQALAPESGRKVISTVYQLESEQPELVAMWMKFYKVKSWAKQKGVDIDAPDEVEALTSPDKGGYPLADVSPHGKPAPPPKVADDGLIPPLTEDEIAAIAAEVQE